MSTFYILYTADVMKLLRCSMRKAQRVLERIRKEYKKPPDGLVTAKEFCQYRMLDITEVINKLNEDNRTKGTQ